jgi:allantoinase
LNQPGRTAWEGFETGTIAAISSGITTVIDMPLNSIPPTTTVANLSTKQEEARKVGIYSDLGFYGGIIPGNSRELIPLLRAGVKGFKCFLINSGVIVSICSIRVIHCLQEFPHVTSQDLEIACNALDVGSRACDSSTNM